MVHGPAFPAPKVVSLLRVACCLLGLGLSAMDTGPSFGERCARAKSGASVVRILHFGDSHLLSQGAYPTFQQFFQAHYGNGGPGLSLPWIASRQGLTASATRGWRKSRKGAGDGRMGLAGGFLETGQAGETATVGGAFLRLRLHLLATPGGGKVQITVDGAAQGEVDLASPAEQLVVFRKQFPATTRSRTVTIRTTRAGTVRLLGVALEGASGALYSPLAFNGARADWLGAMPESLFRSQVEAESPDLVVLAFGTNEASASAFQPELYRKQLETILDRFQRAAPGAALVLAGPPDARLKHGKPQILAGVIAVQKAVAAAFGGLFVDQRAAMGGPDTIEAWFRRGWANSDRIHLMPPGYQWLAQVTLRELLTGTGQARLLVALPPLDRTPGGTASLLPGAAGREPLAARPPEARPIYTFRFSDGRVLITDDPTRAEGFSGQWIGRQP